MAAKIVDKEDRKRKIAQAALELFVNLGFENTTMARVARAAGIGKGTIYEYFSSKDDLIAMSIQIWVESLIENSQRLTEEIEDPWERIQTFVRASMEACVSDHTQVKATVAIFQIILTNIDNNTYRSLIRKTFPAMWKTLVEMIMDGDAKGIFHIRDRSEAMEIAVNLTAFLDGIFLHYVVTDGGFDLMDQVNHYMKRLLESDLMLHAHETQAGN